MLPDMDVMSCRNLAVPMDVMQHVVRVESSFNRYAIGVVGGRLVRQPASLPEAIATARMLRERGFNFSLGLAQVNRYNLGRYGLSLERAFDACPNLQAGARILADCLVRSGNDWGKSLSCYYSGNFVAGFRDGYVQKVFASMRAAGVVESNPTPQAIAVVPWPRTRHSGQPGFRAGLAQPTLIARHSAATATVDRSKPAATVTVAPPVSPALAVAAPVAASPTGASALDASPTRRVDQAFVF